jgi:hypothetical protein
MLMNLLFDGRFDDYRREAAIGDSACIFVHVPKTAGTSLRAELAARLQPDVNIEVDYNDTTRLFRDKMDDAVTAFLQGPAAVTRFASGHVMGRHVAQMRAGLPGARFVTFLRDPVQRVVSDFRHQRSKRHPGHERFRATFPTIEDYASFRAEANKAAQHLISPAVYAARDPNECVEYLLRTYAFIGVQEMYPISFRTLTALIGEPAWPSLRENVGAGGVEEEITTALVARIRQANALDCALYDAVFPRWRKIREALAAFLT